MVSKIASIDGLVSEVELRVFIQLINREFSLSERQKDCARQILFEAHQSKKSFEDFARDFYRYFRKEPALLENAVDVLLSMVYADNKVSLGEQRLLVSVAEIFHLSAETLDRLVKRHHNYKTVIEKASQGGVDTEKIYANYKKFESEQESKRFQQESGKQESQRKVEPPPESKSPDPWFVVLEVSPYESRASTERFIAIQKAYEDFLAQHSRAKR